MTILREPLDPVKARALATEALGITTRLAPGTYAEAAARYAHSRLQFRLSPSRGIRDGMRVIEGMRDAVTALARSAARTESLAIIAYDAALMAAGFDDRAAAEPFYRLSVSIPAEQLADSPAGMPVRRSCNPCLELVTMLNNFGVSLLTQGKVDDAQAVFTNAYKRIDTAPQHKTWTLWNLALAAAMRGDRVAQQRYLLQELDLRKQGGNQGDASRTPSCASAIRPRVPETNPPRPWFFRQAIEAAGDSTPSDVGFLDLHDTICSSLVSLVVGREASSAETERLDRECGDWTRPAPDRDPFGSHLTALSRAALARQQTEKAVALASQAVTANQSRARGDAGLGTFGLANALLDLGTGAVLRRSSLASGVRSLARARRIFEHLDPRGPDVAETLAVLGRCEHLRGRNEEAAICLHRALTHAEAVPNERIRSSLSQAYATQKWASV